MRSCVVSYAREDAPVVHELVKHLPQLGFTAFVDTDLRGSEDWWSRIVDEIVRCEVLVAVVSRSSLNSVACHREREYALRLGKPILPVAVEPLSSAMPTELSSRQVVDFSRPDDAASAFALAGALASLPPAPALPTPLPPPPPPPLSYLAALVDTLDATAKLDVEQQWRIVDQVDAGLRSSDAEERRGAADVLTKVAGRDELVAPVFQRVQAIQGSFAAVPVVRAGVAAAGTNAEVVGAAPLRGVARPVPMLPPTVPATTPPAPPARRRRRGRVVVKVLVGLGLLFVLLVVLVTCALFTSGPDCYTDIFGNVVC